MLDPKLFRQRNFDSLVAASVKLAQILTQRMATRMNRFIRGCVLSD